MKPKTKRERLRLAFGVVESLIIAYRHDVLESNPIWAAQAMRKLKYLLNKAIDGALKK